MDNADRNIADRKAVAARLQRIKDRDRKKAGSLSATAKAHLRDVLYKNAAPFKAPKERAYLEGAGGNKEKAQKLLKDDRDFRGEQAAEGLPSREEDREHRRKAANKKKGG